MIWFTALGLSTMAFNLNGFLQKGGLVKLALVEAKLPQG
jgi:hypothetical protein